MHAQRQANPALAGSQSPVAATAPMACRQHRRLARRAAYTEPNRAAVWAQAAPHSHPTVMGAAVLQRMADVSPQVMVDFSRPKTYECLGLAQAMVDFTASVPSVELLSQAPFNVERGSRRVISLAERHAIIEALDEHGCESQVSPGGSLANTLVAISRLSQAHNSTMRVAMAGCVGTDTLGVYFNSQLQQAGVSVLLDPDNPAQTGTVMVLTTPDAQRSFLSFFDSGSARMTRSMAAAVAASKMVIIEGYMLEMPGASTWVLEVARLAQATGAQIVLTAGDPTVVQRHRTTLRQLLQEQLIDVLFCNKEEAAELLGWQQQEGCTAATLAAGLAKHVSFVVCTDGSRGSSLAMMQRGGEGAGGLEIHQVAPYWAPKGPVDVCGAGDAYAAGIIYAVSHGYDINTAGQFAARVAAAVISRHGAQLDSEDARELVKWLPDHVGVHWPSLSMGGDGPHSHHA